MQLNFCVLDTETTGLDATKDTVVEIAIVTLDGVLANWLIHPERPIPPEVSAIHHITDADVADKPNLVQIAEDIRAAVADRIIVAHNAPFDRSFLTSLGLQNQWFDTLRFARHLWPHAPGHGNQVLRYWRQLSVHTGSLGAHRAAADALVTRAIFIDEVEEYNRRFQNQDWADIVAYVESPLVITTMPFGKHKGVELKALPRDYVEWLARNVLDLDADLKASLQHHFQSVRFGS